MSTATSIAQFMAILSGGTNPSLFRQNQAAPSNDKATSSVNFEALVNTNTQGTQSPTVKPIIDANRAIVIDGILPNNIEGEDIVTGDIKLETIDTIIRDGEFIGRPDILSTDINQSSPIWKFIQQQASLDSNNQLVLNLSEKGLPDNVIQELKSVFGENDLVTIIRDPKLNAQLDNALEQAIETNILDVSDLSADSSVVVKLVGAILHQNKGGIANTLTFSVNSEKTTDEGLDILINDTIQTTDLPIVAPQIPVQFVAPERPITPVEIALKQSIDIPVMQSAANPVSNSVNPFTALKSDMVKGTDKPLESALPQTSGTDTRPLQAISDRVVAMGNNNPQNAGNFNPTLNFTDATISADGESLMIDGDYAIPFEAALKTASQAANPLLTTQSASQNHPATHSVALSLTKMAAKSIDGETNQSYRLRLDPPELGRLDIEMDIIENTNKMKIVINVEKPETLGLLQRDMHALLKSMQDAGFENISQQDLTFNLSDSHDNMAGNSGDKNHGGNHSAMGLDGSINGEMDIIESEMSIIIDPITGQKSVNMLV